MSVYIVITDSPDDIPVDNLKQLYPSNFQIAPNVWAVKSPQLSEEVSKALFPFLPDTNRPKTRNVVVKAEAWWGYYSRTLWEWFSTAEATSG